MSLVWIGFAALLAGAGVSDALTYRIPNWISVALALLFVLAAGLRGAPFLPLWPNVAAAGIVLGIGYLLFRFTKMGAGDA
ncbi:MAG TPA: prepilin peptidase, partial [Parvularculaceae bacterium]|nr:prepilin peptidase [Parvularculaceae bacterium]